METSDEYVQGTQLVPTLKITERAINAAGPGPYYVYLPGISVTGLANMVYWFNTLPGGKVFKIISKELWTSPDQLPEGAARREKKIRNMFDVVIQTLHSHEVPATSTLEALQGDRTLMSNGLVSIGAFDLIENVELDAFNLLIHPHEIQERAYPEQWKKLLRSEGGMLGLRRQWLDQALEGLRTGRMLEDIRRLVDARPALGEIWTRAIVESVIPAVESFTQRANIILAAKEEDIRTGAIKQYDPYMEQLMWCLGRLPERTALSRTMENMGNGGNSLSAAEVERIVAAKLAQVNGSSGPSAPVTGSVFQTMQCEECGEELKMVHGGPPRKCRFCGFEFRLATETTVDPIPVEEEQPQIPTPAEAASIADDIANNITKKRKS